jgi:anti-sigma regulatory factor (Ser/Thr protein kinase)
MSYDYTTDLAAIRAVVHRYAVLAGLPEPRATDLVLAVSEVAANTVRHARSPGSLKIWYDTDEIVCQVHDDGIITDPTVGRHKPSLDARGGHGLWIVNEVCDQVDMRSDETGTTIRLHMKLPRPRSRSLPARGWLLSQARSAFTQSGVVQQGRGTAEGLGGGQ